jgi:predicted heme/steroid binding protein
MGLVLYDGQVLAVGGRHYWKDGEWATSKVSRVDVAEDASTLDDALTGSGSMQ